MTFRGLMLSQPAPAQLACATLKLQERRRQQFPQTSVTCLVMLLAVLWPGGTAGVKAQPCADLAWQTLGRSLNGSLLSPGTVLGNVTVRLTPMGPWLAYWDSLPANSTLVVDKLVLLTTCDILDAIRQFSSLQDRQRLPDPAVWISTLLVSTTIPAGQASITYIDTTFSCQDAVVTCRPDALPNPTPAKPISVTSGWQFLALLGQLARSSGNTCLPLYSYSVQLADNISLLPLQQFFSTRLKPVPAYVINVNLTIQPALGLSNVIFDLAEARNLIALGTNNFITLSNLTLVNLGTAPPIALAFPLWAFSLSNRADVWPETNKVTGIHVSDSTLVVAPDEVQALAEHIAPYTAKAAASHITSWMRFAVTSMTSFSQIDDQTIAIQGLVGLGLYMTNVTFSAQPLPSFPVLHNESGIGRIMDNSTETYPWIIMIDNEEMLLDNIQPWRMAETHEAMLALNRNNSYLNATPARIVFALTQSFNMTPSLWRNASQSMRPLNNSVTISSWPQSMPITLGMGDTPDLISINDSTSSAVLSFRDLILSDLPIVQRWQPNQTDAQINDALQGGMHAVRINRSASTSRVALTRVELRVSAEEVALRRMCVNRSLLDVPTSHLAARCLAAQLYLQVQLDANPLHLVLPAPTAADSVPLTGQGTQLSDVTFSAIDIVAAANSRPDLATVILVWQGKFPANSLHSALYPTMPTAISRRHLLSAANDSNERTLIIVLVCVLVFIVIKTIMIYMLCQRRHQMGDRWTEFEVCGHKFNLRHQKPGPNAQRAGVFRVIPDDSSGRDYPLDASRSVSTPATADFLSLLSQPLSDPTGAHRPLRHRLGLGDSSNASLAERLRARRDARSAQDGGERDLSGSMTGESELGNATHHHDIGRNQRAALSEALSSSGADPSDPAGWNTTRRRSNNGKGKPFQEDQGTPIRLSTSVSSSGRIRRPSLVNELAALTQDMTARISDQLLEICEVIGSGGYSTVYRGQWQGLPVAVKTVIFGRAGDNKTMALQEAAISKSINHPHIVTTYCYDLEPIGLGAGGTGHGGNNLQIVGRQQAEADTASDQQLSLRLIGNEWRLYLVMEYMDGMSLKEVVRTQALMQSVDVPDMVAILEIAWQVAQGMQHLHSKQIIHGDLKPENVLLKMLDSAPLGVVAKVADFGLSVSMNDQQSHVSNWYRGTPFYVSPEVCANRRMSKASDVFAYGVILWEMYHSVLVWRHTADGKDLEVHPAFPRFHNRAPAEYVQLTHACIEEDPLRRPAFGQIADTLRRISRSLEWPQATFAESSDPPVDSVVIHHSITTISERPAQEAAMSTAVQTLDRDPAPSAAVIQEASYSTSETAAMGSAIEASTSEMTAMESAHASSIATRIAMMEPRDMPGVQTLLSSGTEGVVSVTYASRPYPRSQFGPAATKALSNTLQRSPQDSHQEHVNIDMSGSAAGSIDDAKVTFLPSPPSREHVMLASPSPLSPQPPSSPSPSAPRLPPSQSPRPPVSPSPMGTVTVGLTSGTSVTVTLEPESAPDSNNSDAEAQCNRQAQLAPHETGSTAGGAISGAADRILQHSEDAANSSSNNDDIGNNATLLPLPPPMSSV